MSKWAFGAIIYSMLVHREAPFWARRPAGVYRWSAGVAPPLHGDKFLTRGARAAGLFCPCHVFRAFARLFRENAENVQNWSPQTHFLEHCVVPSTKNTPQAAFRLTISFHQKKG